MGLGVDDTVMFLNDNVQSESIRKFLSGPR